MALTEAFYEAVTSGNTMRVHIMMKDSLLMDLSFLQFKEMEDAAKHMQGLYVEHDGRDFNMDKTAWTDDYMNKLMVQVISNFSHERIDHLQDVIRYLRPINIQNETSRTMHQRNDSNTVTSSNSAREKRNDYQEQKRRDKKDGCYKRAEYYTMGIVSGAILGGVVASVVETSIVGGVIGGAAIGGVAVYMGMKEGHRYE